MERHTASALITGIICGFALPVFQSQGFYYGGVLPSERYGFQGSSISSTRSSRSARSATSSRHTQTSTRTGSAGSTSRGYNSGPVGTCAVRYFGILGPVPDVLCPNGFGPLPTWDELAGRE